MLDWLDECGFTDFEFLPDHFAAQAHYLITGDKDLLALAETYPIITPAAFWSLHGG